MCLGIATNGRTGLSCTAPLLSVLLEFLDDALLMKPANRRSELPGAVEDGKEPYGPACRDYFWILCRLVENLLTHESHRRDADALIDFDALARQESILQKNPFRPKTFRTNFCPQIIEKCLPKTTFKFIIVLSMDNIL
jgi:hypothetical protein